MNKIKYLLLLITFLWVTPLIPKMADSKTVFARWTGIEQAARAEGISPKTLNALLYVESWRTQFRFSAEERKWVPIRSSANAYGMGQLKPGTAADMGCGDILYDRDANVRCAAKYLAFIKNKRGGKHHSVQYLIGKYHDGAYARGFSENGLRHIRRFNRAMRRLYNE